MKENELEENLLCLAKIVEQLQQKLIIMEDLNNTLVYANRQLVENIEQNQSFLKDYQQNAIFEILDFENNQMN